MTTLCGLCFVVALAMAQSPNGEQDVRATVEAFYAGFNGHDFGTVPVTDDWEDINPSGGTRRGRAEVLKELREVHSTFLKGVTDRIEDVSIRFPTTDVAIAVVNSQMSTYVTPDGARHENERHIRTFVIVRRAGRWLIEHDQNTTIQAPPD